MILHQVPVLLGGGRPFFQALPEHTRLRLLESVAAPGVTHLHYLRQRGSPESKPVGAPHDATGIEG